MKHRWFRFLLIIALVFPNAMTLMPQMAIPASAWNCYSVSIQDLGGGHYNVYVNGAANYFRLVDSNGNVIRQPQVSKNFLNIPLDSGQYAAEVADSLTGPWRSQSCVFTIEYCLCSETVTKYGEWSELVPNPDKEGWLIQWRDVIEVDKLDESHVCGTSREPRQERREPISSITTSCDIDKAEAYISFASEVFGYGPAQMKMEWSWTTPGLVARPAASGGEKLDFDLYGPESKTHQVVVPLFSVQTIVRASVQVIELGGEVFAAKSVEFTCTRPTSLPEGPEPVSFTHSIYLPTVSR